MGAVGMRKMSDQKASMGDIDLAITATHKNLTRRPTARKPSQSPPRNNTEDGKGNKKLSVKQPVPPLPLPHSMAHESTLSVPQTIGTDPNSQTRTPQVVISGQQSPRINGAPASGSVHSGPVSKNVHSNPKIPSMNMQNLHGSDANLHRHD